MKEIQYDNFWPDMSGFKIRPIDIVGATVELPSRYPKVTGALLAAGTIALTNVDPVLAMPLVQNVVEPKDKKVLYTAVGSVVGGLWEFIDGKISKKAHVLEGPNKTGVRYASGSLSDEIIVNAIEGGIVGFSIAEAGTNEPSFWKDLGNYALALLVANRKKKKKFKLRLPVLSILFTPARLLLGKLANK